jgi:hypothetical protein
LAFMMVFCGAFMHHSGRRRPISRIYSQGVQ